VIGTTFVVMVVVMIVFVVMFMIMAFFIVLVVVVRQAITYPNHHQAHIIGRSAFAGVGGGIGVVKNIEVFALGQTTIKPGSLVRSASEGKISQLRDLSRS